MNCYQLSLKAFLRTKINETSAEMEIAGEKLKLISKSSREFSFSFSLSFGLVFRGGREGLVGKGRFEGGGKGTPDT